MLSKRTHSKMKCLPIPRGTHARTHARTHAGAHARTHARTHSCLRFPLPPFLHNNIVLEAGSQARTHTQTRTHARTHARIQPRLRVLGSYPVSCTMPWRPVKKIPPRDVIAKKSQKKKTFTPKAQETRTVYKQKKKRKNSKQKKSPAR